MKIVSLEFARKSGLNHVRLSGGRAAITDATLDTAIERRATRPGGGPTIVGMVKSFATATARWAKAGLPIADEQQFNARLAACRACPKGFWKEGARFGLGRCDAPGCGCTKLKLWMATERCPLGFWR